MFRTEGLTSLDEQWKDQNYIFLCIMVLHNKISAVPLSLPEICLWKIWMITVIQFCFINVDAYLMYSEDCSTNQLSATVLFTSSKFARASDFLQTSKYYSKWERLSLQRIMESIIEFSKQITAKNIVKIMHDRWTYQFQTNAQRTKRSNRRSS